MMTFLAEEMFTPIRPLPIPSMSRLRRMTVASGSFTKSVTLMFMPFVPAASTPAMNGWPSIVIDLVIVSVPKPPGSSTLMMPLRAVLEMQPANVLQGAVRLQGLASSPTPETHVRVAWALAMVEMDNSNIAISSRRVAFMNELLLRYKSDCGLRMFYRVRFRERPQIRHGLGREP